MTLTLFRVKIRASAINAPWALNKRPVALNSTALNHPLTLRVIYSPKANFKTEETTSSSNGLNRGTRPFFIYKNRCCFESR